MIDISDFTRVSSILAMMPTKDNEGKWGFPLQQLNQDMLTRKADLGTDVHKAISAHLKDEFYPLTDQANGYLESYMHWEKIFKPTDPIIESTLHYEPMKLKGTPDLIATRSGKAFKTIIDYKCTVTEDRKKWPMQAAFYHFLAKVNGHNLEDVVYFLRLDPNGKVPDLYEYVMNERLKSSMISIYNSYMYLTEK